MSHRFRRISILLPLFLSCQVLSSAEPAPAADLGATLTSTEKQQLQREGRLIVDLLQNYHYSGRTFREIENQELIANYLNALDPRADFLTAADGSFIQRRFGHSLKTVYVFRGDLQPGFEIFDLYAKRVHERLDWIDRRLKRVFEFTTDETFAETPAATTPVDATALDARWESQLKNQVLREMIRGRSLESARAEVARLYQESGRNLDALDALAVRERFLDSMIRVYDPHSGYFSADSAREFALDMAGAVGGIGVDLRKDKGSCIVSQVQPGGPADLGSELAEGDTIEAVAEGKGDWTGVTGLRLQEIVSRIRGAAGSTVRLAYHKADAGERKEVTLTRSRVLLASERARGAISTVRGPDGSQLIGWIELPAFYSANDGADSTSATEDVRELITSMQAAGVSGLVIDLRNNPGGTLTEAVGLSSLFLPDGTVMYSRSPDGKPKEQVVITGKLLYTGPLVILTSSQSASASEIFSGAMKFHRRALVVGDTATFGKGTAQAYIDLATTQRGEAKDKTKDWGTLRLTTDRFYLPDGGAVQHDGVASDVVLPDQAEYGRQREADLPRALPAASFTPPHPAAPMADAAIRLTNAQLDTLRKAAEQDIASLPEWTWWRQQREFNRSLQARPTRTLNEQKRRAEWAEVRTKLRGFRNQQHTLMDTAVFATRPVEIAALESAAAAHETKLRAALATGGLPGINRLMPAAFLFEDDLHRLRELPLDAIEFRNFDGDEAVLAAAFSAGANRTVSPAEIESILQDFQLLEHKTDATLVAVVQARLHADPDAATSLRRGCEALLAKAIELDGELGRARPPFDVPLRESLRLAASWATLRTEKTTAPQPNL